MIRLLRNPVAYILSMMMLFGSFAPALAQTPAASPVASPVAAAVPSYEDGECAYDLPDGMEQGKNAFCGWVTAPMYPDADRPETVRIPIIRFAATTDTPAADPLLILLGGPGQNMSAVLPAFDEQAAMWNYMLERQDVILFDQRGMGKSEPSLTCPIEKDMASGEANDIAVGFGLMNCSKQLQEQGIDLTAFTTTNNAADIEAIRVAMGYEQVNLYGISYGSKLALAALRDYPDSIRSTIIASPLPMEDNVFATQTIGFDHALKYVWDACAADEACAAANPDPAAALETATQNLKANPVKVQAANPMTGDAIELELNDIMFLQLVYMGVFVSPLTPYLPNLVTQTAQGDYQLLEELSAYLILGGGVSMGVLLTYFCQEEVAYSPQAETVAKETEAGIAPVLQSPSWVGLGDTMYPLCDMWKLDPSDPIENEPVVSDEPMLILTGSFDPITPASNAEPIAANFPNSQTVEFTAQGHDPASSAFGCSEDMITGYLNDPNAKVDGSCAIQDIEFAEPESPQGTPIATPVASPAGL